MPPEGGGRGWRPRASGALLAQTFLVTGGFGDSLAARCKDSPLSRSWTQLQSSGGGAGGSGPHAQTRAASPASGDPAIFGFYTCHLPRSASPGPNTAGCESRHKLKAAALVKGRR